MAENYNLGSRFGFNVSQKTAQTSAQPKQEQTIDKTVGDLFDSMTSYVAKYENVFNGEVAKEINMYSRQAMIVGMNLKSSDSNIRRFDVNI